MLFVGTSTGGAILDTAREDGVDGKAGTGGVLVVVSSSSDDGVVSQLKRPCFKFEDVSFFVPIFNKALPIEIGTANQIKNGLFKLAMSE